jgi:hypothetical protein
LLKTNLLLFLDEDQATSIYFHPTQLIETQPLNLVLQELKSFATQLGKSPIMNALFSPSTVPIVPSPSVWPSNYEAKKYLPPNKYELPATRRGMLQTDADPPAIVREKSQQILPFPSNFGMDSFFNDNLQSRFSSMQNAVSGTTDRNFGSLKNFLTNQSQAPSFTNFSNQQKNSGNNHVHSSVMQTHGSIFQQNQNVPSLVPVPYISPSLKNMKETEMMDEIDVRMDKRPDSDKNQVDDLRNNFQVVEIGNGNQNSRAKNSEQIIQHQIENLPMMNNNETKVEKFDSNMTNFSSAQILNKHDSREHNAGDDGEKPYVIDVISLKSKEDTIEKLWKEKIKALNDDKTNINFNEENENDDTLNFNEAKSQGELVMMNQIKEKLTVNETLEIQITENPTITENFTYDEMISTTLENDVSITEDYSNANEITTNFDLETTTQSLSLEDRLDINLVKTLAG